MTEADLRGNIKETIAMQKVIDNMTGSVPPVTEAAVEKFYTDNPGKFAVPERVRAAHILLEIPQDATAAQKTELQRKLESIRFEIEAESITFTDAAAKYSQDKKTASSGGNLGIMTRDNMPKSFADALFNAKPGTISPVLESQSGYHILQMRELISAGTAPLEEASATIRQFLEQETKQTALRKSVAELKAKTTIETFMSAEEFAKRHP
jgi:parvulin-like peptidyl-prolyl isomerase